MSASRKNSDKRATVKVCVHCDCLEKGSEKVYEALKSGLSPDEAMIEKVDYCFGHCEQGPNIAINDNIVKGVRPFTAIERVRKELSDPSCKADGLGSKSLDNLDQVLKDIEKL